MKDSAAEAGRRRLFGPVMLGLAAVLFLAAFVHLPSLGHIPRADQLWYLMDVARADGLLSLLGDFYSYNRVRVYAPGDVLAFRPGVFLILGLERWLFGDDFRGPQAVGILLHLILLCALWRLLGRIRLLPPSDPGAQPSTASSVVALSLLLVFSVLAVGMDMVAWPHIHGYLVFLISTLLALDQVLAYALEEGARPRRLWAASGALLGACFTYEAGVLFAVLSVAFLVLSRRNGGRAPFGFRQALLLLTPAALFLSCNGLDYALRQEYVSRQPQGPGLLGLLSIENAWRMARYTVEIPAKWLLYGLLPLWFPVLPGPRFGLRPEFTRALMASPGPGLWLSLVSAVASAGFLGCGASLRFLRARGLWIGFLVCLYLASLELLIFGRALERGVETLFGLSSYYGYVFWLFFILAAYSSVDADELARSFRGALRGAAFLALAGFVGTNAYWVHHVNRVYARSLTPKREMLRRIADFVRLHRSEADFSFALAAHPPEDEVVNVDVAGVRRNFYLTDILFGRHIRHEGPKHVFSLETAN